MEEVIALMKEINIAQLVVIGGMFWFFYCRLDAKIEKINDRLDKLEDKVNGLDRRLVVIETMIAMNGCCALKNTEHKRVE